MKYSIVKLLAKYLRPWRWRLAAIASLMLLSLAARLARPQILRSVLDLSIAGQEDRQIFIGILLLGGVAVLGNFVDALVRYGSDKLGWASTNELRYDLMRHVLKLDLAFHKGTSPGALIERVDVDVTRLAELMANFLRHIVINALFIIGSVILLWREHYLVGVVFALYTALSLALISGVRAVTTPVIVAERKASAQVYGLVGEQLSTTEDMQGVGAQFTMLDKLRAEFYRWLPHLIKTYLAHTSLWSVAIILQAISQILSVILAAYLWRYHGLSIGTAYLIIHYAELIQQPVHQIRMQLQEMQRAASSLRRINELLAMSALSDTDEGISLPALALPVEARNLVFSYEGDNNLVLDRVSFSLPRGETLGIIGRTGSGKSTLARLIARQYDPSAGELLLGGIPTAAMSVRTIRERISFVTQEVQVFQASVRDNLTFFDDTYSDDTLIGILRELGLMDWYRALPVGLDTMMESGSNGLSAGEGQLLALARAFLRNPSIVVLDEASAKLDPITENLVGRALKRLLDGRTGVIIAHRLATLEQVDHLLLLDGGRILEFGKRTEIEKDPHSHYARLKLVGLEEVLT